MAENKKNQDKIAEQYYSKLIVNKANKTGIAIGTMVAILVMATMIFNQVRSDAHWLF